MCATACASTRAAAPRPSTTTPASSRHATRLCAFVISPRKPLILQSLIARNGRLLHVSMDAVLFI